jgi:mercuric ion binding protein
VKALPLTVLAAVLLPVNAGFAAEQTAKLVVENMSCESCPYIVKQSLLKVSGVTTVVVSFADKTATVGYDDDATDIQALITATTNAGYPSRPAN